MPPIPLGPVIKEKTKQPPPFFQPPPVKHKQPPPDLPVKPAGYKPPPVIKKAPTELLPGIKKVLAEKEGELVRVRGELETEKGEHERQVMETEVHTGKVESALTAAKVRRWCRLTSG